MSLMTLHCPQCDGERLFERPHNRASCPDREDSPDGGCPELACLECGTALLTGFAVPSRARGWDATAGRPHSPERAA